MDPLYCLRQLVPAFNNSNRTKVFFLFPGLFSSSPKDFIMTMRSGSVDPHIFEDPDPDPGRQKCCGSALDKSFLRRRTGYY